MLEALASFMPQKAEGALGSHDLAPETRRRLADESHALVCPVCGPVAGALKKQHRQIATNDDGSAPRPRLLITGGV